jgi:hypothetical protein
MMFLFIFLVLPGLKIGDEAEAARDFGGAVAFPALVAASGTTTRIARAALQITLKKPLFISFPDRPCDSKANSGSEGQK